MTLRTPTWLPLLIALANAGCTTPRRPDGGEGLLPVGAVAPNLVGSDRAGVSSSLVENRGKPAVVYFYPKDGTPGCTKEACAFRDAFSRFKAENVSLFGVSRDSKASHDKFAAEHNLPFVLVSDETGDVAKAYGVSGIFGMTSRVTFLVGRDGRIAKVFPDVDPGVHADQVLTAARALQPLPTEPEPK